MNDMEKYGIDKETNDRLNKTAFQVALAYRTTRSKAQTPDAFLSEVIQPMSTIKQNLIDVTVEQSAGEADYKKLGYVDGDPVCTWFEGNTRKEDCFRKEELSEPFFVA